MNTTNQLPEPELGYIKTGKSNQPAFSARQMREAMLVCGAQNAESAPQAPLSLTPEPVLTVEKEPDYWSNGHFYEGNKPYINPTKVWHLPIGTKLYTTPQPAQATQAEAQQPATGEPVVDVRCEGCGYMTHHREHMGCVRAAKQHTHPAPSVPDGWSDRHTRVAAFALRRFADAAWVRSDEAAQKSYMGDPSDYKAFQSDAKDAEEARAILLTAAQAQKGGAA